MDIQNRILNEFDMQNANEATKKDFLKNASKALMNLIKEKYADILAKQDQEELAKVMDGSEDEIIAYLDKIVPDVQIVVDEAFEELKKIYSYVQSF